MVATDLCGRFILCDFRVFDTRWRVVCVYAPNDVANRVTFFHHLRPYLICDRMLVLLGDFNCVCDEADRAPTKARIDKSARLLLDLVDQSNLFDAATVQLGGKQLPYTHFQNSPHARLDRIYSSTELIENLNGYAVDPVFFTDHCMVSLTVGHKRRNKNINWKLWKLNNQLLKDEKFLASTTDLLQQIGHTTEHIFVKWERFKQELKQLAIERGSIIKFQKSEAEKTLQHKLRALVELECKYPGQGLEDITRIKAELDQFYHERYQGAVVRTRAEKYVLGEQPTKKAMEEEKRYAMSKEIHEIEQNSVLIQDKEIIANALCEHYKEVFGNNATSKDNEYLKELVSLLPQLDQQCTKELEEPFSMTEIEKVVDALPNKKTPGPDGITAEFYKLRKNILCPILLGIFQEAYETNSLPPSFLRTHTILIPKTDDKQKLLHVTGYRPITLCKVDYKIFAKLLTNNYNVSFAN